MDKTALLAFIFFMAATGRAHAQPKTDKAPAYRQATFAGGCFWCMEPSFEKMDGVVEVIAGYTGGAEEDPNYEQVSTGETSHRESVQVTYDPAKVSYADLLNVFWRQIDPTDPDGQFADRGPQYRTAVFYYDAQQKELAEESRTALARSGKFKKPIVTEILPAGEFYSAEEGHQDYYKTNAEHYEQYKYRSGREPFLKKTWANDPGKNFTGPLCNIPSPKELKRKLTPLQYAVTRQAATERPFQNEYWDNKREGIYVDIISGEALFSSTDKFDSGTGWPSFLRPLAEGNIVAEEDKSLPSRLPFGEGESRTEVRSKHAGSHLGHLFPDGPGPTGQRFCINSAALRFVPKEDLDKEGYGQYKYLFSEDF